MLRSLLVMTTLILLAAPSAHAGLFDRETVVRVATEVTGDKMSYSFARSVPSMDASKDSTGRDAMLVASANGQRVVMVEGAARVTDGYGIERDTVAYRIDTTQEGDATEARRCYRLDGGLDTVRIDNLGDISPLDRTTARGPVSRDVIRETIPATSFFGEPCLPGLALAGRELREGDVLLLSIFNGARNDGSSAPASATTFEGRAALAFVFGQDGASVTYVVADGLPGIVEMTARAPSEAGEYLETVRLVGHEPGVGIALAPPSGASLPDRHPDATFAAPDPLRFDDAGFAPAFSYDDAYAAILADPTTRFAEWLAANPDAILAHAYYQPDARDSSAVALATEGSWSLSFAAGTTLRTFHVARVTGASTPLGPIATPTSTDRVLSQSEGTTEPLTLPSEIADAATIAALAAAQGLAPAELSSLAYMVFADAAIIDVASDNGDGTTTTAIIDPTRGATRTLFTIAKSEGGLLAFFEGGTRAPAKSGLAALDAPTAIAAGGAATAGALVLLLFLLPLFTRLRKDRLLDNPIRARLYERVRAEPGIHRAELVDFAGIGEGATRHHLMQLTKHHLLVETHVEGFVRYFAAGEVPPEFARRESVLRAGSHRAVYDLYAREPSLSLRDAGARLGMSAPSVHRAKKKLETAGLLPAALDTSNAVAEV